MRQHDAVDGLRAVGGLAIEIVGRPVERQQGADVLHLVVDAERDLDASHLDGRCFETMLVKQPVDLDVFLQVLDGALAEPLVAELDDEYVARADVCTDLERRRAIVGCPLLGDPEELMAVALGIGLGEKAVDRDLRPGGLLLRRRLLRRRLLRRRLPCRRLPLRPQHRAPGQARQKAKDDDQEPLVHISSFRVRSMTRQTPACPAGLSTGTTEIATRTPSQPFCGAQCTAGNLTRSITDAQLVRRRCRDLVGLGAEAGAPGGVPRNGTRSDLVAGLAVRRCGGRAYAIVRPSPAQDFSELRLAQADDRLSGKRQLL